MSLCMRCRSHGCIRCPDLPSIEIGMPLKGIRNFGQGLLPICFGNFGQGLLPICTCMAQYACRDYMPPLLPYLLIRTEQSCSPTHQRLS